MSVCNMEKPMNWSVDTILLIDSPWEKGSSTLCLYKNQRVSSVSLKVCCLYSVAGGGPKTYCIIYIVISFPYLLH